MLEKITPILSKTLQNTDIALMFFKAQIMLSSHVVSERGVTSGCRCCTVLLHRSDSLCEGLISCLIDRQSESRSYRIRQSLQQNTHKSNWGSAENVKVDMINIQLNNFINNFYF